MKNIVIYYTDVFTGKGSHDLLIKAACDYAAVRPSNIKLVSERGKKPFFSVPGKVSFSISHSDNIWACSFCDSETGFDIQRKKVSTLTHLKISKRFFSLREFEFILNSAEPSEEFFRIWTKKEAAVKLLGTGIDENFKMFDTISTGFTINGLQIQAENINTPFLKDFEAALACNQDFKYEWKKM